MISSFLRYKPEPGLRCICNELPVCSAIPKVQASVGKVEATRIAGDRVLVPPELGPGNMAFMMDHGSKPPVLPLTPNIVAHEALAATLYGYPCEPSRVFT